MKRIINNGVMGLIVGLLSVQTVEAQGTTYLSNLGQTSAGSSSVGDDSWIAIGFKTGTNGAGYTLDFIQLRMIDASGNPRGFMVMLYSAIGQYDVTPGSNIGTLNGSLNPITAGTYSYTPASGLTLLPAAYYFLVLTAGTPVATGAYEWSNTGTFPVTYNPVGGWRTPVGLLGIDNYSSNDGLSWGAAGGYPQFAINAAPIPEPGVLSLLGLSGLIFLLRRRKAKRA